MPCPNADRHTPGARARCWGCSHPEELAITPEDAAEARRLANNGWRCASNKYHLIRQGICSGVAIHLEGDNAAEVWPAVHAYWPLIEAKWREAHAPSAEVSAGVYRAMKLLERGEVL